MAARKQPAVDLWTPVLDSELCGPMESGLNSPETHNRHWVRGITVLGEMESDNNLPYEPILESGTRGENQDRK